MKEYNISGELIRIPVSTGNYLYYMRQVRPVLEQFNKNFDKCYNREGNCDKVYYHWEDMVYELLWPIAKICVAILNQKDVYSIDEKIFMQDYAEPNFGPVKEKIIAMMHAIVEIENDQEFAKEDRRERKASRRRWVGMGYGVGGAIAGAAKAGALNAASGTLHSARNLVGNAGSAVVASVSKSALFSEYREILRNEVGRLMDKTVLRAITCIEKNTDLRFDYLIDGKVPDKRLAESVRKALKDGKIQDSQILGQIVNVLRNEPDNLESYKLIWVKYGDESGDLRKMAEFFHVPLADHILSLAVSHTESIFAEKCKAYIDADNPLLAAVQMEREIMAVHDEIVNYCEKQKIESKDIPAIQKCSDILREVETELCTVNGITYKTRQEAVQIRHDRKIFYDFLQGKSMADSNIYGGLCKLEFQSVQYQNNLEAVILQEKKLRNVIKLAENLKEICTKYFTDGKTPLGEIDVFDLGQPLQKKEGTIRKIIQLDKLESPLMLVNYASNGKSGILFTNCALRIYGKSLFSSENKFVAYASVDDVVCCGKNKYKIHSSNGELEFVIKSGLSYIEQNRLCAFLNEILFTLKNIRHQELRYIKDINESSLECECGTKLPVNTTLCPSCFKMYTKENVFVDTILCRSCQNRMPIGKKFCSKCGNVIDDVSKTSSVTSKEGQALQFCPNCGKKLEKGKIFCSKCGTKIADRRITNE